MYRPNRIGPWPVFNSLSTAVLLSDNGRFTALQHVGISVRPTPVNVVVGDRNDALFAIRNFALSGSSNNCICPSILLRSNYDDVPSDGMMISLSASGSITFQSISRHLGLDLIFGVAGSSLIPSVGNEFTTGSGSYRRLPARKTLFECPADSVNCFECDVSWNGSIIAPGGHTNPFYFGFLIRNYHGSSVSGLDFEGTLSASVYRGDLDVFDPVR